MKFIDQSANELRLNLINSEYSESELSVLTREIKELNSFVVEYGILGASHFFKLKKNNLIFAEVFACVDMEIENSSLFVGNMDNRIVHFFNDWISYEFESSILEWNSSSEELYSYFEKNFSSSFIFPSQENYLFLPKTQVIFKVVSDTIVFETMHAYPNENKLVFTKSIIKEK